MKIEVSLAADYCSHWGVWEGLRELVQNWLDERDRGTASTIEWSDGVLTLTNHGTTVGPADFGLLGRSNKDADARGKWGEGLKVGSLALLRAGRGVSIRSGDWCWRAVITRSGTFEADVLAFNGTADWFDGVEVEVIGVTTTEYVELQQRVLDLRPRAPHVADCGSLGEVLLDDTDRGSIYFRGIFVCKRDNLAHGYNFRSGLEIDRDRSMVADFDFRWAAAQLEAKMLATGRTTGDAVLEALEAGDDATKYLDNALTTDARRSIAQAWAEKYGPDAVPGDDAPDGMKAVKVPLALREVLGGYRTETIAARQREARTVATGTLSAAEAENMDRVLFALEDAGYKLPVMFVQFECADVRSRFDDGLIKVDSRTLASPTEFLSAIVAASPREDAEIYTALIARARGWV